MHISTRTALLLTALLASFLFAYHDVLLWLVDDWDLDGDYSHGYLVVPIALYLAWERRDELRRAPLSPSVWGLLGLLASMLLVIAGTLAAETFVARVSIVTAAASAVWFAAGFRHVRILGFPFVFLLTMIPIPSLIFNQVAFPLQLIASEFGATALAAVSIPVLREGNLIFLPTMTLEVAEACSGIRSLLSLFTLSLLYGYFSDSRTAVRVLLAVSTIPIAVLVNGLRVASTGAIAHLYGQQYAEGFFHSTSGWAMFVVAGGVLVCVRAAADLAYDAATARWPHTLVRGEAP